MTKWYEKQENDHEIVLSTRVRLARNVKEFPFVAHMSLEQKNKLIEQAWNAVSQANFGESMKFEKQIKEQLMHNGLPEDQASENAKKQAMVISKMAQEIDKKELINEGKRNDRRNQIAKQLQDSGMDQKSAAQSADYTIKLIMKRQGLSPE